MRIKISFESKTQLTLPVHYGALLQGFIYKQLDASLADWLHEEAYRTDSRVYKMFTFSRLFGRFRLHQGRFTFQGPVSFQLASVDGNVLGSLAEHLLKAPHVRLGQQRCRVSGVEVLPAPEVDPSKPVRVKALSPITTYSTLMRLDGRKKTYYYAPQEEEWSPMLVANLARKAASLGWQADPAEALKGATVRPRRVRAKDQKIVKYKGTVVKGWMGIYELDLPEPYFWLAYDAGLGAKNAQGFGMVEVIR